MPNVAAPGINSYLQLSRESVPGTPPATAEAKYELISENIVPVISTITDPSMSNVSISRRSISPGPQYVAGPVRVRCNYVGMENIYRAFLASHVMSGAGVPRTHVHKEQAALSTYTVEVSKGNVPTSKVNQIVQAYITSLKFSGQAATGDGGMVMVDFDVMGTLLTPNATPLSGASLAAAHPVIYHQMVAASMRDGSTATTANQIIRSFEVSMTQPHVSEPVMGSLTNRPPTRNGPFEVNWMFEEEWTDYLLLQQAQSATNPTNGVRIEFKQAASLWDSTNQRTLTLASSSVTPASYDDPIDGPGTILQKINYQAFYNATDLTALILTTINENTLASG